MNKKHSNPTILVKKLPLWFYHLSKKYGISVKTLGDIPYDEFVCIKNLGIDYVWLIGLWQRSPASGKIKELQGEKDKIGSAYSIVSYDLDKSLGSSDELDRFLRSAHSAGLGIIVDVIPNHMSIDSKWLMDNPDWFINTDVKPYDNYTFSGPNLSSRKDVEIRLEDKYYSKQDASVVFALKRQGKKELFVYHGNNGEGLPWNDTAQLDYTNTRLRKKMLSLIKELSFKYDGIRFDAAMLLMSKEYKRLWFPEPGNGCAVPSRDSFATDKAAFYSLFPGEFWSEVGAVVNKDGLYVFEVFWGLERDFLKSFPFGYVYNAGFSHHLIKEENKELKNNIKAVLEEEQSLFFKFLNYLSSPDDDSPLSLYTPVDKYKGACCFLASLPSAVLFTHGQIDGYRESYPVDIAYPKKDEDAFLFDWHKNFIAPVLTEKRRMGLPELVLFFPFLCDKGEDDDVFFFFIKLKKGSYIAVYNNSAEDKHGWVNESFVSREHGDNIQKNILDLLNKDYAYDAVNKDKFCFDKRERALFLSVKAYQSLFLVL